MRRVRPVDLGAALDVRAVRDVRSGLGRGGGGLVRQLMVEDLASLRPGSGRRSAVRHGACRTRARRGSTGPRSARGKRRCRHRHRGSGSGDHPTARRFAVAGAALATHEHVDRDRVGRSAMTDTFLRGAAAVVGVSEFHYKRGESPDGELRMTLRAIVEAAADAGVSPRDIDGFVSYGGGDNDGTVVGASLMSHRIRWSNMIWGGGGGGAAAAITNAAVAIAAGQAQWVVVYRAMAQQDSGRLGYAKRHL